MKSDPDSKTKGENSSLWFTSKFAPVLLNDQKY